MSRVLCTFPGRYGDLLWALPTVRAISETLDARVDLLIAGEFAPIVPLLQTQSYVARVYAEPLWGLTPPNDWRPPTADALVSAHRDHIYHLGYRGWPSAPLAQYVYQQAQDEYGLALPPLDLARPWITADPWTQIPHRLTIGFSECWFELKVGLLACLLHTDIGVATAFVMPPAGSRWTTEQPYQAVDWVEAARRIAACDVFLGDCSALHVLAVALGKPVVLVEPMEARHNAIFFPLGTYDRVRLVRGNDGLPSFDARHTADTLREVLAHV